MTGRLFAHPDETFVVPSPLLEVVQTELDEHAIHQDAKGRLRAARLRGAQPDGELDSVVLNLVLAALDDLASEPCRSAASIAAELRLMTVGARDEVLGVLDSTVRLDVVSAAVESSLYGGLDPATLSEFGRVTVERIARAVVDALGSFDVLGDGFDRGPT